jgi:hypothetical protein
VQGQFSGWSDPVQITDEIVKNPLIAVNSKGFISIVDNNAHYISKDNGKTFTKTYQFIPDLQPYYIYTPNGMAYDTNDVLWVYWAWDWCSDDWCTFIRARYLVLSRSFNYGETFENVCVFNGSEQIVTKGSPNPRMIIGKNNTIHFIRDSLSYIDGIRKYVMIYSQIPKGELNNRFDIILSAPPDSLNDDVNSFHLTLTANDTPFVVQSFPSKTVVNIYPFYTKLQDNNTFTNNSIVVFDNNKILWDTKVLPLKNDSLLISYTLKDSIDPASQFHYYTTISTDNGNTFEAPIEISDLNYRINLFDDKYYYGIDRFFPRQGRYYFKFDNILSQPIDSFYLGNYIYSHSVIDRYQGINIAVTDINNKAKYIGKDIVTSVINKNQYIPTSGIDLKNYPNPFNTSTTVSFSLSSNEQIKIVVYDIFGRQAMQSNLINGFIGRNNYRLDLSRFSSGVYLLELEHNIRKSVHKLLLLK